jgi:hypothetical protein
MNNLEWIETTAWRLLSLYPQSVPRFRLLRDVLKLHTDDLLLLQAQTDLSQSLRINQLVTDQREDGSWGRFHSRDSRVNQAIPTTEIGVYRALSLGLEADHPILYRASSYILDVMQGKHEFPDRVEKNDDWPTGERLFLAATLSLIIPGHPELDHDREVWLAITQRSFQSGSYQASDEIRAHAELTGARLKYRYLVLNGKYQLAILGSQRGMLPHEMETALLHWLSDRPDGIGYLGVSLKIIPPLSSSIFERWLASWELLAHSFPTWVQIAEGPMEWLFSQRSIKGFWDFGSCSPSAYYLPLSDNIRTSQNRQIDWTTRVLILMRKYQEDLANI